MADITNYRGKRPKIVWGSNTLLFRYPLDNAVVFSEPRPGSVVRRVASGEEDAWTLGHDVFLRGEVQYIPSVGTPGVDTGWDGADGWAAFLDYAWRGGAFTFYPDASDVASRFEAALAAPLEDEEPEPEVDFTRRLPLTVWRRDGGSITGYEPAYKLLVYAPRSTDPTEATLLTPATGAPHSEPFAVASTAGVTHTIGEEVTACRPYLDIPKGSRGKIDFLEKTTEIGQLSFLFLDKRCGDDPADNLERWWTAFFGDEGGAPWQYGCKVELYESLDGGSTWALEWTGRITDTELEDSVTGRIETENLAGELADADVFVGGLPHASINYAYPQTCSPVGRPIVYGPLNPVPPMMGQVDTLNGRKYIRAPGKRHRRSTITQAFQALADGRTFEIAGVTNIIPVLQFNGDQADIVIGSRGAEQVFPLREVLCYLPQDATDEHFRVRGVRGDGMEVLVQDASADFRIIPRGEPSAAFPLLVNDVHPWQMAKDVLDGKYGYLDDDGEPLRAFPYDATALNALIADGSWGKRRFVMSERMKVLDFLEERICKESGGGWRPDAHGRFVPLDLRLSSAAAADTIEDGHLVAEAGAAKYTGTSKEAITRVNAAYHADQDIPEETEKGMGDFPSIPNTMMESHEVPLLVVANDARARDIGDKAHDLDFSGFRTAIQLNGKSNERTAVEARVIARCDDFRAPFAQHAATYTLRLTRAGAGTLQVGDFRVLNVSELPDPATNRRGGSRLAVCTEREPEGAAIFARFLDLGTGTQLPAPLLSELAVDATDPTHAVTVRVDFGASWDPVMLEVAQTETSVAVVPGATSALWVPWRRVDSDGGVIPFLTVTLAGLTPGKRIWVRGRSLVRFGNAAPSPYAYATAPAFVDLTGLTAPSGLAVVAVSTDAITVTWTNGESAVALEVLAAAGAGALDEDAPSSDRVITLPPGSTRYTLRSLPNGDTLAAGTTYRVGVRHLDAAGGASALVSITQATTAEGSAPAAPAMAGIAVLGGTGSETTGERTGVLVTLYPGDPTYAMEVRRADDDGGGAPDLGTIEVLETAIPPNTRTFTDELPLDGVTRHYSARHIPGGAWTAWKAAIPGVLASGEAPQPVVLPQIALVPSQTATVGTLLVEISDPQGRLLEVASKTKSGNAGVETAYAVIAAPGPYTTDVALVDGQSSTITYRIQYHDANGAVVTVYRPHTFNGGVTGLGLDDLADVNAPVPADGDVLTYDQATDTWKATAPQVTQGELDAETAARAAADAALDGRLDALETAVAAASIVFDGGGSALTPGIKGDLRIPFACTITGVSLLADQAGDLVVDIWKDTFANAPPDDADSITASAPPTLSGAAKSEDTTLTGWTKSLAAGDVLRFNVDSAATITRATLTLTLVRA